MEKALLKNINTTTNGNYTSYYVEFVLNLENELQINKFVDIASTNLLMTIYFDTNKTINVGGKVDIQIEVGDEVIQGLGSITNQTLFRFGIKNLPFNCVSIVPQFSKNVTLPVGETRIGLYLNRCTVNCRLQVGNYLLHQKGRELRKILLDKVPYKEENILPLRINSTLTRNKNNFYQWKVDMNSEVHCMMSLSYFNQISFLVDKPLWKVFGITDLKREEISLSPYSVLVNAISGYLQIDNSLYTIGRDVKLVLEKVNDVNCKVDLFHNHNSPIHQKSRISIIFQISKTQTEKWFTQGEFEIMANFRNQVYTTIRFNNDFSPICKKDCKTTLKQLTDTKQNMENVKQAIPSPISGFTNLISKVTTQRVGPNQMWLVYDDPITYSGVTVQKINSSGEKELVDSIPCYLPSKQMCITHMGTTRIAGSDSQNVSDYRICVSILDGKNELYLLIYESNNGRLERLCEQDNKLEGIYSFYATNVEDEFRLFTLDRDGINLEIPDDKITILPDVNRHAKVEWQTFGKDVIFAVGKENEGSETYNIYGYDIYRYDVSYQTRTKPKLLKEELNAKFCLLLKDSNEIYIVWGRESNRKLFIQGENSKHQELFPYLLPIQEVINTSSYENNMVIHTAESIYLFRIENNLINQKSRIILANTLTESIQGIQLGGTKGLTISLTKNNLDNFAREIGIYDWTEPSNNFQDSRVVETNYFVTKEIRNTTYHKCMGFQHSETTLQMLSGFLQYQMAPVYASLFDDTDNQGEIVEFQNSILSFFKKLVDYGMDENVPYLGFPVVDIFYRRFGITQNICNTNVFTLQDSFKILSKFNLGSDYSVTYQAPFQAILDDNQYHAYVAANASIRNKDGTKHIRAIVIKKVFLYSTQSNILNNSFKIIFDNFFQEKDPTLEELIRLCQNNQVDKYKRACQTILALEDIFQKNNLSIPLLKKLIYQSYPQNREAEVETEGSLQIISGHAKELQLSLIPNGNGVYLFNRNAKDLEIYDYTTINGNSSVLLLETIKDIEKFAAPRHDFNNLIVYQKYGSNALFIYNRIISHFQRYIPAGKIHSFVMHDEKNGTHLKIHLDTRVIVLGVRQWDGQILLENRAHYNLKTTDPIKQLSLDPLYMVTEKDNTKITYFQGNQTIQTTLDVKVDKVIGLAENSGQLVVSTLNDKKLEHRIFSNRRVATRSRVPCFTLGTKIKTPKGYTAVENLRTGDVILDSTQSKLTVLKLIVNHTETPTLPVVCFQKDSLGQNIPDNDTSYTPEHVVYHNGVLKKAQQWINPNSQNNIRNQKLQTDRVFTICVDSVKEHNFCIANGMHARVWNVQDFQRIFGQEPTIYKF